MKLYMKNLGFLGFPNHCITQDGKIYSLFSNRYLATSISSKGYHRGTISYNGIDKKVTVHRLVAMAFVGGDFSLEVNHKDGNKDNNHYSNLEWVTSLENIEHAVDNGLREVHHKLTETKIHHVCSLLQDGMRNIDVAEVTGVSKSHVSGIKTGRYYPEIVSLYDITYIKKADRISLDKVILICKLLEKKEKDYRISKELNINHRTIGMIRKRLIYTSTSCNFNW